MKIFVVATRIFGLVLSLLFVNSIYGQSIYTLPAGTQLDARMDNEINSEVFSVNDTFTATIFKSLIVQDVEMLPVGTILEGRIVKIKRADFGRKRGDFEVKFESLKLPNGVRRQIDGELIVLEMPKTYHTANAVLIGGGAIIGAVFGTLFDKGKGALIGAGTGLGIGAGAILLQKGKAVRIKSNEEIKIRLKREVTLPVRDF